MQIVLHLFLFSIKILFLLFFFVLNLNVLPEHFANIDLMILIWSLYSILTLLINSKAFHFVCQLLRWLTWASSALVWFVWLITVKALHIIRLRDGNIYLRLFFVLKLKTINRTLVGLTFVVLGHDAFLALKVHQIVLLSSFHVYCFTLI